MKRFSKSKIIQYENCPYAYKKLYIDKVKTYIKSEALEKGIAVHKIVELLSTSKNIEEALTLAKTHKKFEKYIVSVEKFIEKNKELSKCSDLIKPEYSEVKIYNEKHDIVGIIDRVDIDGERVIVTDYKTGKVHNITDYIFELSLYAFLFEQKYGTKVTHVGVWFIDHKKFEVIALKRQFIRDALEKVEIVKSCIAAERFHKIKSWRCNWCQVRKNGHCN